MEDNPISAKDLRLKIKANQTELATLNLFHQLGNNLFSQGWHADSLQTLLSNICIKMGAPHGLMAIQEGATLKVLANIGQTYPIGARIPVMSQVAKILKSPAIFSTSTMQTNLWSFNDNQTLNHYVMPIALNARPIGLLAFASVKTTLNDEESNTCQSLCGFLGLGLSQTELKSSARVDDTILDVLTPREREIFALLPSGHSNTEIADKLSIAPGTVKIHVERILNKLGMRDRTQAAVKAVQLGY